MCQNWIMTHSYTLTCRVPAWFKIPQFSIQGPARSHWAERGHRPEGLPTRLGRKTGQIGEESGPAGEGQEPGAKGHPVDGELASLKGTS